MDGTHLGTEAISHRSNLGKPPLPQRLDPRDNDRINLLGRMRMLPILPLANPRHHIIRPPPLKVQRIALEQVRDERRVPVGRELVREELAVGVDAVDVRDVEKCGVVAGLG